MPRALTSGVSGMLNNQLVLDVTANNLANVNTTGFKGSRVSFATALIQTENAGSAPGSAIGGTNPKQVGLGMSTSSIDLDMRQGALQPTGRNLDLAIQGDGFFELTDGTRPFFSRVGNFGFDSDDSLVDLGTGFKLVGNTYNLKSNPDGSQSLASIGTALNIPRGEAFPPKQSEAISFQGNLSSTAEALRGSSLQSLFPVISSVTGASASEDTRLQDLTLFKGGADPGDPANIITMYMYGTKPTGEAYAGEFTINPWEEPTTLNDKAGSLGFLVAQMNAVLSHGNERFGTVRIDNGTLTATGVGSGDGFSLFLGEQNPILATFPIPDAVGDLTDSAGLAYNGTPVTAATHTIDSGVSAGEIGLLRPSFVVPADDFSGQVGATIEISILINGNQKGLVSIPAADYTLSTLAERTFQLDGFPHVIDGDEISYDIGGTLDLTAAPGVDVLTWSTAIIRDDDTSNLTNDSDADSLPDLFQEGSSTDANFWVYEDATNTTFSWYRARFVPEVVTSSIEVFDAQGGRHTVDARYIRNGTRVDPNSGARLNSWDMILGIDPSEGTIIDDIVAGIEFDQNGRFTGSVGTTVHGNTYTGAASTATVQIDWNTTGPTDPATIRMDFGESNTFKGLTSFGSASTAAAISQDGYSDGKLDSLSVSAEGDILGLYTNGVSRKLAQLQLATFRNPAGLTLTGNNLFQESTNSGTATRRVAGQGSGFITSGALEGGNVDIATEFTRIITAQRGFQVSARVIQTADQLLEELANLRR
jgi:flagellar hook protein FlgE